MRSASAEQSTFYPHLNRSANDARSKLAFEVSDHLARHLILVSDPKDIVSQVELARKRKIHLLIQRYVSQIQYGCENASCTTPTCFSCRKRLASSPVRKYTTLSARSLACFLADARDSEAALCPHEPVRPVESQDFCTLGKTEHTLSRRTSAANHSADGQLAQKHVNGKQPTTLHRSSKQTGAHVIEDNTASQNPNFVSWASPRPPQRPTKDPKSFTQALFDSLPLKLLERTPCTQQRSTLHAYHFDASQASYGSAREEHKGGDHQTPIVRSKCDRPDPTGSNAGDTHEKVAKTYLNGGVIANGHAKEPTVSTRPRASSVEMAMGNGVRKRRAHSPPNSGEVVPKIRSEESANGQNRASESSKILDGPESNPQLSSSFEPEADTSLSVPTLTSLSTEILKELKDLCSKTDKGPSKLDFSDFFRQSLHYCLKDPSRLSASFGAPESCRVDSGPHPPSGLEDWYSKLNPQCVRTNLRNMSTLSSWHEIIRNLSIAAHSLYLPAGSRRPPLPAPMSNDLQAAFVCVVGLQALSEQVRTATDVPDIAPPSLFDRIRAGGRVRPFSKRLLALWDVFDDFESLNLLEKIVNIIANRWTLWKISKTHRNTDLGNCENKPTSMIQSILDYMAEDTNQTLKTIAKLKTSLEHSGPIDGNPDVLANGNLSRLTLYWLRTLMLRDWDGRASVRKSDTVGIILQILAAMYERHGSIGLERAEFWTQVFVERFDPFDMPMQWLDFRSDNKTVHLLSYSFLFPPETVVTYFRAINYSRMTKITEGATLTKRAYNEFVTFTHSYEIPVARSETLQQRLGIAGLPRFVMEVRRDNILKDAINQIWRRQKRELLKPLKVRIGTDEGEEGVDSGGVQQELFRVLFGQALDPSYGMFTVDEQTRMTWFRPQSLEPLLKFEALGILMSLAVYNSITLPITFPVAFYRKLLGLKVKKLAHIMDGWPVLAKNMQVLLDWEDGDVSDIFMRTYEFTYETSGGAASIDMEQNKRDVPWPPQPTRKGKEKLKTASFDVPSAQSNEESTIPISNAMPWVEDVTTEASYQGSGHEASLVTNANREQYVKDYIFWLTDKSIRPQYEAFSRGFYTCLDRTALSIFTAEALQSFIEGVQEIDMDGLQASTAYDGYTADDQVIKWFWEVVKSWDQDKKKMLLEFITASDRVPVNGVNVIGLVIQCAGRSDEILPRSMTCFATFLLPLYSSKEVLEKMLGIAIEHAKGFGTI